MKLKHLDLHQKFKIRVKKRKFPNDQTLFVAITRVIQFKVESEPFLTERPSTDFYPTTGFVFPLKPGLNNIGFNLQTLTQCILQTEQPGTGE